MSEPRFTVHVSVELDDSVIEEKLRYTTNDRHHTYSIGEAETLSKDGYGTIGMALARLTEFCSKQLEE